MAAANGLSWETVWSIMECGDALPDTFDAKTEEERLKKQRKTIADEMLRDFNRAGEEDGGDEE